MNTNDIKELAELCGFPYSDCGDSIAVAKPGALFDDFKPDKCWNDAHRVVDVLVARWLMVAWVEHLVTHHWPRGADRTYAMMGGLITMGQEAWATAALEVLQAAAGEVKS